MVAALRVKAAVCLLALATAAAAPRAKQVNLHTTNSRSWLHNRCCWCCGPGCKPIQNPSNLKWATNHQNAITGFMVCCGQWGISPQGVFIGKNMSALSEVDAVGLGVSPLGDVSNLALMNRSWQSGGAVASAVQWAVKYNLSALVVDNETPQSNCTCTSHAVCHCAGPRGKGKGDLPGRFADFMAAMQAALGKVGKRVLVDISSRWGGDIVGPSHLRAYAATGAHFMDMESYYGPGDPHANQFGRPEPRTMADMQVILDGLVAAIPRSQIAVAVGTVEQPGPTHANASCGFGTIRQHNGNVCCSVWSPSVMRLSVYLFAADAKDRSVACCNYGWNQTTLREFLRRVDAAGIKEVDVWREDLEPPKGQITAIPDWFADELATYLNPGYGGRASSRKGRGYSLSAAAAKDGLKGLKTDDDVVQRTWPVKTGSALKNDDGPVVNVPRWSTIYDFDVETNGTGTTGFTNLLWDANLLRLEAAVSKYPSQKAMWSGVATCEPNKTKVWGEPYCGGPTGLWKGRSGVEWQIGADYWVSQVKDKQWVTGLWLGDVKDPKLLIRCRFSGLLQPANAGSMMVMCGSFRSRKLPVCPTSRSVSSPSTSKLPSLQRAARMSS